MPTIQIPPLTAPPVSTSVQVRFNTLPNGAFFKDDSRNIWRKVVTGGDRNAVLVLTPTSSAPGMLYTMTSSQLIYPVSPADAVAAQKAAMEYVNQLMRRFGFVEGQDPNTVLL